MENGNLLHLYLEVWILVLSTERASCPPQQESHWAWLSRAGRSGWGGAWPGRRSAGGRPPGHTRPPSGPWRLGPGEGWRRYLCWVVSHLSGHPTPIRWQQLVWCSHLFDETRAAPFTVQNTLALMRLPEFWYYYVICKVFLVLPSMSIVHAGTKVAAPPENQEYTFHAMQTTFVSCSYCIPFWEPMECVCMAGLYHTECLTTEIAARSSKK